jgi:hypothetical protein
MCEESKYACILIQHLHNSVSLESMLTNVAFLKEDLIYVLFILYQSLFSLRKEFTHYDLHSNNVLLFKMPANTCIEYVYHVSGKVITFKLPYVPKIIDYGRCYFKAKTNSQQVKKNLCSTRDCNPNCGKYFGFGHLNDGLQSYHIQSDRVNQSHDLRLLRMIHQKMRAQSSIPYVNDILSRVVYEQQFGTPENVNHVAGKIVNVSDAYQYIKNGCNYAWKMNVEKYKQHKVDQTIHIYDNGKEIEYE